MNHKFIDKLKFLFPNETKSKKFDYEISLKDIHIIVKLINDIVFKGKINLSLIDFSIEDYDIKFKINGSFSFVKSNMSRSKITIFRHKSGDNFGQVVSVICHEMIHAYDRFFGELYQKIKKINDFYQLEIKRAKHTQFVNRYDVHSRFFLKMIDFLKNFGIIVKIMYDANDKNLIKNLNENTECIPYFDEEILAEFDTLEKPKNLFFNESNMPLSKNGMKIDTSLFDTPLLDESEDDPKIKKKVEKLFNSLKNTRKDIAYLDKDHWYITLID